MGLRAELLEAVPCVWLVLLQFSRKGSAGRSMAMVARRCLSFGLGIVLAVAAVFLPGSVAGVPRSLGKVASTAGVSKLNGIELVEEATLFPGDIVTTESGSTAVVYLPQGGKVHVGPEGVVRIEERDGQIIINLEQGGVASQKNSGVHISVRVAGLRISPTEFADFQVASEGSFVYVLAGSHDVQLFGREQTLVASAGEILKVELAPADDMVDSMGGEGNALQGKILRSVSLGSASGGQSIAALSFIFAKINNCGPTVSPRDPDCGSGYAAN